MFEPAAWLRHGVVLGHLVEIKRLSDQVVGSRGEAGHLEAGVALLEARTPSVVFSLQVADLKRL